MAGTTGTPKGVAILHDSITRFLHDFGDFASESEPLNGLLTLNVAFDASIAQIYPSLTFGGCLTIAKVLLQVLPRNLVLILIPFIIAGWGIQWGICSTNPS